MNHRIATITLSSLLALGTVACGGVGPTDSYDPTAPADEVQAPESPASEGGEENSAAPEPVEPHYGSGVTTGGGEADSGTGGAGGAAGANGGEEEPPVEEEPPGEEEPPVQTPVSTELAAKWDRAISSTGSVSSAGTAVDGQGNVVVAGTFNGTLDLGGGPLVSQGSDVFVAKFDAQGQHLWSKRFGDAATQLGADVAVDAAGNVVVVGSLIGSVNFGGGALSATGTQFTDVFVAKLDGQGQHLWSKRFGDINAQQGHAVAVDASGNVVISGDFQNTIGFGGATLSTPGDRDAFIAKFSPNGAHIFSHGFGGAGTEDGSALAIADSGTIALGGISDGDVDFGQGVHAGDGVVRGFVAWFSPAGANLASQRFDGGTSNVADMLFSQSGELVVAGNFKGSVDVGGGLEDGASGAESIFVARYADDTTHASTELLTDVGAERVRAIAEDSLGSLVVAGQYTGSFSFDDVTLPAAGSYDGFVVVLGAQGHRFWNFADAGFQAATGVAVGPNDDVVVVGDFSGLVDLGGGAVGGAADGFVATYTR